MLDFRNKKDQEADKQVRVTNYFDRRQQRKLLLLVGGLGLLLILLIRFADPKTWSQLGITAGTPGEQGNGAAAERPPKYYDTYVRPKPPSDLPLDTFIAKPEIPAVVDRDAHYFPGVDPELFSSIKDYTYFRAGESDSWFNLLGVLKRTPQEEINATSTGEVGFVQLYNQMNVYRGKLVTVRGVLKRAFDVQASKNDEGIKTLYQLWVFPDGGPISPVVVYALELPDGFPTSRGLNGEAINVHESVTLTGFAFKNWIYGAGDNIESAPLLLIKSFTWHKREPRVSKAPETSTVGLIVAGSALVALLVTFYAYWSSNRLGPAGAKALDRLHEARTATEESSPEEVGASLKALAEAAEQEDRFGYLKDDSPPAESELAQPADAEHTSASPEPPADTPPQPPAEEPRS